MVNVTNGLLSIILLILVNQFYPTAFEAIILAGIVVSVLYFFYWLIAKFPTQRKLQKAKRLQEQKDEADFWEHHRKSDAIRAKYDPEHVWNEATSLPQEYLTEIQNLNLEYRDMLKRRNGWTDSDFYDY
jgi:hypothetical protein